MRRAAALESRPIKAKGLVLDLLATLKRGSMPVRALVAAGALFGIDENRMRVAITRAVAEGLVERDQRGEYRARPERGLGALVAGWRRLEGRTTRWSGDWWAVLDAQQRGAQRRGRRGSVRALELCGFRQLYRGVHVRPANLVESPLSIHARLTDLGLDSTASVALLSDLDPATDRLARSLWDASAIRRGYAISIAKLEASRRRLATLPDDAAMIESFTLGGTVIRQLVRDPLLPPPLLPAGELAQLVRVMRAYETAGRASWRRFLERHGVGLGHTPAGLAAPAQAAGKPSLGGLL